MAQAENNNVEFRAEARFQRISPQKARLVLELIKGRRVEDALNTLQFTNKGVAPLVLKLLRSALENANYHSQEKGLEVDVDNLYVKRAVANDGPRAKRIRPAPMGRAYRYQRRQAHLEIALAERHAGQGARLVQAAGGHGRAMGTRPKQRRQTRARVAASAAAAEKA